ncbi:MAG: hypothetical protein Q4B96_00980 [Bacillota bacterium]|nr:hypothetical protein [Bacillota bacterium]
MAAFSLIRKALCLTLPVAALFFCACAPQAEPAAEPEPQIIEPGVSGEQQIIDSGIADEQQQVFDTLSGLQSQITSFYYEQSVPYPDGQVFMQVWRKDQLMKVVSSSGGYLLTEFYYDFTAHTVLSYSPGDNETALLTSFDPESGDLPDDPTREDFSQCSYLGRELVDGVLCYKLAAPQDETLWIDPNTGFPLQISYTDSLGEKYTVRYENIQLNNISDADVAAPDDIPIVVFDMQGV